MNCVAKFQFYEQLLTSTVGPVALLLLVALATPLRLKIAGAHTDSQRRDKNRLSPRERIVAVHTKAALLRGRGRRVRGAGARRPGRARRRPRALRRPERVEVALVRRFEVVLLRARQRSPISFFPRFNFTLTLLQLYGKLPSRRFFSGPLSRGKVTLGARFRPCRRAPATAHSETG